MLAWVAEWLWATRLQSETVLDLAAARSQVPWLCSIPPVSDRVWEPSVNAREWPSGSKPCAAIPGIPSPGTHQTSAGCPAASTALPEPHRDNGPVPRIGYLVHDRSSSLRRS